MSVPALSVRRPVAVLTAFLALTVFGALSFGKLPVDLLPDLAYPTLTIQTAYPDAAPVSVERFVTRPVEEAVGVIPGVLDMRSVSRAGISEVVLEFDWDTEMDFVVLDVREKLGLVELPREAELPRVLRYDPSLDPIIRLAYSGPLELDELRQIAERVLKRRFEAVRGVAAARVRGGLDPEITVEVDEERLASLGLTLGDVASALEAENINRPGGTLKDWGAVYLVRTLHEFEDLEQIRRTVIRDTPKGRLRVEDVAEVRRGAKDRVEITRAAGEETVEIALHREGSANTLAVADGIREELASVRGELAEGTHLTVLSDQSTYIARAVDEVRSAALLGGLLAILVLYFFLRDLPSTAIIALSIPVSIITIFLPLLRLGVSLNVMSLGGLALGVGMLVDNSIVVLEAIDRRRSAGLDRAEAAARGASDVAGAVTAATATTVSVFLPIVFVKGVAGQLFYDLAVTVCLSLVASLFVSLTLIPSLAGLGFQALKVPGRATLFDWSKSPQPESVGAQAARPGRLKRIVLFCRRMLSLAIRGLLEGLWWLLTPIWWIAVTLALGAWKLFSLAFRFVTWPLAKGYETLESVYPGALRFALRLRGPLVGLAFLLFVGALFVVPRLGTQLVPDLSQEEFAFRLRLPEGTPLASTAETVAGVEEQLLASGRFARVFSVTGALPSTASGRQTLGENLAQIDVVLPDGSDTETEADAVAFFRRTLALYAHVEPELVRPSVLALRPPIEVFVFADDLALLDRLAQRVAGGLAAMSGLRDVATTSEPGSPEVRIALDRERAATLGLDAETISRALRRQIRGEVVGQFREEEERLDIRLRASQPARERATKIASLRVRGGAGQALPVSALAEVKIDRGPAAIHRDGGARVARVLARTSGGDLGTVVADVNQRLRELGDVEGAHIELAGQNRELEASLRSLQLALALAVFLVYVVMAMQFESLRYPFVILISVPLGAIGVVAALLLTGTAVSVLVLIGVVMLAGIVVNNAIVLVDAVGRRRREGEALEDALLAAGKERLRPILMTTATTVLALLPLAFGIGAGGELRAPMAVAVIGGLSVATLLTLLVVPAVYRLLTRAKEV